MFDFPNAPALNSTTTGPQGVTYTWDGTKWIAGIVSSQNAPINSPQFTGTPTAPTGPVSDNTTQIATDAFVQREAAALSAHNVGRNLLHNGLFNVQQRGAGPWTATGYTADRWIANTSVDTVTFACGQLTDANRTTIGDDAVSWAFQNTFTGTATGYNYVEQRIENVRRLSGKTVTLSFWAYASAALKLGVNLAQYFGTGGTPSAQVNVPGQAVTLTSGAWGAARYSVTFTMPSVSGMTLGTNNNHYTALHLWHSAGLPATAGNAGNIGQQSGVIAITGIQLEIGSTATPLEKLDPRMDLANCQRFYVAMSYLLIGGYAAGPNNMWASWPWPTQMRSVPTVAFSNQTYANSSGPTLSGVTTSQVLAVSAGIAAAGPANLSFTITASADL